MSVCPSTPPNQAAHQFFPVPSVETPPLETPKKPPTLMDCCVPGKKYSIDQWRQDHKAYYNEDPLAPIVEVDGKESSGFVPWRSTYSSPGYLADVSGSKDSSNKETEDSCTGNSWSPSPRRNLLEELSMSSESKDTTSSPIPNERPTTSIKTIPQSWVQDLNLESSQFSEIQKSTGSTSGSSQPWDNLPESRLALEFKVTVRSGLSARTLQGQLLNCVKSMSSGVQLQLERVDAPGKKPEWMLTLKIRNPSFGVDTEIKNMLSLTNLEEILTLHTFSDGWTAIRSWWKSKAVLKTSKRKRSGSPPILIPETGIPPLIISQHSR